MKSYRREWDDKLSCFRDRPVHDWSSHIADAIRYLGVTFSQLIADAPSRIILPNQDKQGGASYTFTLDDLFNDGRTNPGLWREQ